MASDAGRGTYNIEVWSAARKALDEICDRSGISKKKVIGRLIEWFVRQPLELQAIVLGQIPDRSAIYLLRHVADQLAAEVSSRQDRTGLQAELRDRLDGPQSPPAPPRRP